MKVCSIFSQVLKLFSRGGFEKAVKQHKAERHARGFTSWGQFIAMLFCQVGRAHSLREICGGLACCEGTYFDLGRSADACPGSESGYAQRFQCGNVVKRLIWTGMIPSRVMHSLQL